MVDFIHKPLRGVFASVARQRRGKTRRDVQYVWNKYVGGSKLNKKEESIIASIDREMSARQMLFNERMAKLDVNERMAKVEGVSAAR